MELNGRAHAAEMPSPYRYRVILPSESGTCESADATCCEMESFPKSSDAFHDAMSNVPQVLRMCGLLP